MKSDGSVPPDFIEDAGALLAPGTRLDGHALQRLVPDIGQRRVFISGSPASVGSLRRAARHAGARRIHVDSFAGY
jgi:glycine betaine catabolism B